MKYGAPEPLADKTIALHAARIVFKHPTRDETVAVECAPPADAGSGGPWDRFRTTIDSYF